ncbi:dual specificity protein phosphatase family protein [Aspergillus fijiensis CBS 313.89]|uniref:Dual specificity protein phosphatase 3 n=1 Tax=Aspergillus fijiensis CBS 313.89 TaxID=1448319 RepID=A0A8G1VTJ6_9EURO|nr:dual specificity protein phosphatase 3 [Aspergillus fijiensis CBS 313.89]RAK72405.1 dual specificity protein phosphatase 3 [Aspergillus fijiensis CBS 313.89]
MALTSSLAEDATSQGVGARYTPNHEYSLGTRRQKTDQPTVSYEEFDVEAHAPVNAENHAFQAGEFVPDGFFNRVGLLCFTIPPPMFQWSYEMRRQAQPLLPFLYLGPWSCLADRGRLVQEGITLLLAVRDKRLAMASLISGRRAAEALQIEDGTVDFADNQELITMLPRLINHINAHVASFPATEPSGHARKKVLLFCETGNGPSAVVAIAYLMVMLNISLPQALQYVSARRFCIDIDDPASQLLLSFESILDAKRDVEEARRASEAKNTPVRGACRKRDAAEFDMVEDDGYAMGLEAGEAADGNRRPLAPFEDRSG